VKTGTVMSIGRITREKGSILILVLWTLGLLSVFAVYLGAGVRQRLEFLSRIETRNRLQWIAEAGVKRAIGVIGALDKKSEYVDLSQAWSTDPEIFCEASLDGGTFTVGYSYNAQDYSAAESGSDTPATMYGAADAGSRLNVNTADQAALKRLVQRAAAVDQTTADAIASCIVDWRDSDNASLANGAEDDYYRGLRPGYVCKNFPLQTLEELWYVKGMTPEIYHRIEPYLTVYGAGSVNINTASATVLSALGLSDELIAKILLFRNGQDKTGATADDRPCTAVSSIVAQINAIAPLTVVEEEQLKDLAAAGRLATFSDIFIIRSTAVLDTEPGTCSVECVFKKDLREKSPRAGTILGWRVRYGA